MSSMLLAARVELRCSVAVVLPQALAVPRHMASSSLMGTRTTMGMTATLMMMLVVLISSAAPAAAASCAADCAAGTYFVNATSGGACVECPSGHYCAGNATAAVPCAAGRANSDTGSADSSACAACASGKYSGAGATTCTACPIGYQCSDPAAAPVACGAGTYSNGDSTSCPACPAGYRCPGAGSAVACATGTYSNTTGATSCPNCPAGTSCADPADDPVVCSAGTYAAEGDAACSACPAGKYAPSAGAAACIDCPAGSSCADRINTVTCDAGEYSALGDASCNACAAGLTSSAGATTCTSCPAGWQCSDPGNPVACVAPAYSPGGTVSACTTCPAGTECPNADGTGVAACAAGTYSLGSATVCSSCPAGEACPETDGSNRVTCAAGTYSTGNATSCTGCAAGSECPSTTTATINACASGYYSTGDAEACTQCPAGYQCSDPAIAPVACTAGKTSNAGATSCFDCPAGYRCPGASAAIACATGTFTNTTTSTVCQACPAGYACQNAAYAPVQCAAGTYSAQNDDDCHACTAGTYSAAGAGSCSACPAGSECSDVASPAACASGYYSIGGSVTTCTQCPVGYECSNAAANPAACPAGKTSAAGATGCTDCPAGSRCPGGAAAIACAAGTYANATGSTTCTACPAGYSCTNVADAPVMCEAGQYSGLNDDACSACDPGTYSSAGASACASCQAGYQCSDPASPVACVAPAYSLGGATSCATCPAGSACSSASSAPSACASGTYATAGSTSCTTCPAGSSCTDPSTAPVSCSEGEYSPTGQATCLACPAGYKCPDATASPVACGDGQWALSGTANCTVCEAGYMCPSTDQVPIACGSTQYSLAGATSCTTCPAGYQCPSTAQAPVACAQGTYSLAGDPDCHSCPAGYECATTSSLPTVCSAGEFAAANSTSCTTCPAGFACPYTSANTQTECEPGTYATAGSTSCTVCPAGSMCPYTTVAVESSCAPGYYAYAGSWNCTLCPPGWACPETTGELNVLCELGTYSAGGTTNCTVCPAGYRCPYTTQAVVIECEWGSYSVGGATNCTECPAGKSCASRTSSLTSTCAGGYFSVGGQDSCTPCPAGNACPDATQDLRVPCGEGEYALGAASACTVCPAGFSCSSTTDNPVPCDTGYYALGRATNCTACPAGSACSDATSPPTTCLAGQYSTPASANCSTCAAGYMCPTAQTTATPSGLECPVGYYCPAGTSVNAVPCPAGTYGNKTAGISQDDACEICPAGYYCPEATSNYLLNPCPRGHYCPAGTSSSTQFPCSAGYYNDEQGSVDSSACTRCSAGFYCLEGSAFGNTTCPTGYYCPDGAYAATTHPCPAGTYSGVTTGLQDSSDCVTCPAGSYCPVATVTPTQCPLGTFNPFTGASAVGNCQQALAGSCCPSLGLTHSNNSCAHGHYCPTGTVYATDNPCPPGTYTDETNLIQSSDCSTCPAGFSCTWGTGGSQQPWQNCTAGYYCPAGTQYGSQWPCPGGTYSDSVRLTSADECTDCPAGSYCSGAGSSIDGPCSAGYYCPNNTVAPTDNPCPAGTYSAATDLHREDQCTVCPVGHYCVLASSSPTDCPAGTYANTTGRTAQASCDTCPAGYRCPAETEDPIACAKGEQSDDGADTCSTCPAGYYCDEVATAYDDMLANKRCPAGMLCEAGEDAAPDLVNNPCPVAQYCPEATSAAIDCPAGTYSPNTGRSSVNDCIQCPEGSYCLQGSHNITGECNPGYYCEAGSTGPEQEPCPAGTYRSLAAAGNVTACASCPSGSYCTSATSSPVECPAGYFCVVGTETPEPCPIGTYGNTTGLRRSEDCSPCPAGKYCDGLGLPYPTGLCDPGYYCVERAYTSAPSGLPTGGLCTRGGYCPIGSSSPSSCPPGTYSNRTGAASENDCSACDPGFYCSGSSNPYATGTCNPGYYCTGGADTPTQYTTPAGHYTVAGASAPVACEPGTYQNDQGTSSCRECPAGFQCPNTTMTSYNDCPVGHYCPAGTHTPERCPSGTFSDQLNRRNVSECQSCTPGKYCGTNGLSAVSGDCTAGYYCSGGATVANPVGQSFGDRCTSGYYCPAGSWTPTPCPAGTYSNDPGRSAESECLDCTAGWYCETAALTTPTGQCTAGYYCPVGQSSATPASYICPAGYHCPTGSVEPSPCLPGTYTDVTGRGSCLDCPAGYYCLANATSPIVCPAGSYCPQGTGDSQPACPAGTFSPHTGLTNVTQCTQCTGGYACSVAGLTAPDATCNAGAYCTSGVVNPDGSGASSGTCGTGAGGDCPVGHYCPAGTVTPLPCPPGTFSAATNNDELADCLPCTPGSYCATSGLDEPTDSCEGGYYCTSNATVSEPSDGVTGDICPVGSYCPTGSATAFPCPAGTYNGQVKQAVCFDCPAGYYCLANATTYTETVCPAGHYCPINTEYPTQFPCINGTFSNSTGLRAASECTSCPPGQYCSGYGLTEPSGLCDGSYYCSLGASSARPSDGVTGNVCPIGSYCPAGSNTPLACPPGKYCDITGLASAAGNCDAGYYCTGGASVPNPAATICPLGSYCDAGSDTPSACPIGTFGESTGLRNETECTSCTAGWYCAGTGLTSPTGQCYAGYYCPEGSTSPDAVPCTIGASCTNGTAVPATCPAGMYAPSAGSTSCQTCEAGFFCDPSTSGVAEVCPAGFYCPEGTRYASEFPCYNGTFSNTTGLQAASDCTPCLPGSYCYEEGLTAPTGDCSAGYYCEGGAVLPTDLVCPAGAYCPAGSYTPTLCPAGTYVSVNGSAALSDCLDCAPGVYCGTPGSIGSPTGSCSAGYVCSGGSSLASPSNKAYGYICPAGSQCPAGSGAEIACAPGTYQPSVGQDSCLTCPEGYACQYANMTNPEVCPIGYYCPTGTAAPVDCPAGTFGNNTGYASEDDCIDCVGGMYCDGTALIMPTGSCAAGWICASGSNSSMPAGTGSLDSNGACPAGYYCPAGTAAPIACNTGTFTSGTGNDEIDDCLDCTPGFYCSGTGQTGVSGPCDEGFYCPNAAISIPNPPEYQCPSGFRCPAGSSLPQPCPDGQYQSLPQQGTCNACPAGSYCANNATEPITCPVASYCPAGSITPTLCANGTYSTEEGLTAQADCLACPSGKYCVMGRIIGDCSPGYYCLSGSDSPTPSTLPAGEACPAGFYCEIGTGVPSMCINGTVNENTGGMSEADCVICPAGSKCIEGNPLPEDCPPGFYCPTGDILPCPIGTYSSVAGASNSTVCTACPAGYLCDETAITDYTEHPCPPGAFCGSAQTNISLCPAGTYRSSQLGTEEDSCADCPAGYYCPVGSNVTIPCPRGTFCKTNSYEPTWCPLGTYSPLNANNRTAESLTCLACPAGTYGAHPLRYECDTCEAGYVCTGGATSATPMYNDTDGGYICPYGHYCEAGALVESPCPVGTFGFQQAATSLDACEPCAAGSFAHVSGTKACTPCGASSASEDGASTCQCIGENRSFQPSDGQCLCKPGYEFFDENLRLASGDSQVDCQRIVFDRCSDTSSRDHRGTCISEDAFEAYCDASCPTGGKLISSLGFCECNTLVEPDELCDAACRLAQLVVRINPSAGTLEAYDPATNNVTFSVPTTGLSGVTSALACTTDSASCDMQSMRMTEQGAVGLYDIPLAWVIELFEIGGYTGRTLSATSSTVDTDGISNPITCLHAGEGVMWDVSAGNYPVYVENSLYNTNADFDYGSFRTLASRMSSNLTMSVFMFTFTDPGVYVFADSANSAYETYISVVGETEQCPQEDSRVLPASSANMVQLGVSRNDDLILSPDWALLGSFLGGLMLLVSSVVFGMYYFNRKSWATKAATKPKYRRVGAGFDMARYASKGGTSQRRMLVAAQAGADDPMAEYEDDFWDYERQVDLEGFNVKTLYDKLENQTIHVTTQLAKQSNDVRRFYDNVLSQTETLRLLLSSKLDVATGELEAMRQAAARNVGRRSPDSMPGMGGDTGTAADGVGSAVPAGLRGSGGAGAAATDSTASLGAAVAAASEPARPRDPKKLDLMDTLCQADCTARDSFARRQTTAHTQLLELERTAARAMAEMLQHGVVGDVPTCLNTARNATKTIQVKIASAQSGIDTEKERRKAFLRNPAIVGESQLVNLVTRHDKAEMKTIKDSINSHEAIADTLARYIKRAQYLSKKHGEHIAELTRSNPAEVPSARNNFSQQLGSLLAELQHELQPLMEKVGTRVADMQRWFAEGKETRDQVRDLRSGFVDEARRLREEAGEPVGAAGAAAAGTSGAGGSAVGGGTVALPADLEQMLRALLQGGLALDPSTGMMSHSRGRTGGDAAKETRANDELVTKQRVEMDRYARDVERQADDEVNKLFLEAQARKRKAVQAEKEALANRISSGHMKEAEKARVMQEHNEQVQALEAQMDLERARQEAVLKTKLAARRRKKQQERMAKQADELRSQIAATTTEPEAVLSRHKLELELVDREVMSELDGAMEEWELEQQAKQIAAIEESEKKLAKELSKAKEAKATVAVLAEHAKEVERVEQTLDLERSRYEKQLRAKIEAKKRMQIKQQMQRQEEERRAAEAKLEEQRIAAQLAQQAALANAQQAAMTAAATAAVSSAGATSGLSGPLAALQAQAQEDDDEVVVPAIPELGVTEVRVASKPSEDEVSLVQDQKRLRRQLEEKQAAERERLAKELADEEKRKEAEVEEALAAKRARLLAERRAKLQTELGSQAGGSADQNAAAITSEHEKELQQLELTMDQERERQKQVLKQRLEAKRRKKLHEQKMQQREEMKEEVEEQMRETDEMRQARQTRVEREAIQTAIATLPPDRVPDLIEMVLGRRHARERIELQQRLERKFAEDAEPQVEALNVKAADELAALAERQQAELSDLLKDPAIGSDSERDELRVEMVTRHQLEQKEVRERQAAAVADVRKRLARDEKVKQADELLLLRQQQYNEIAKLCQEFAPDAAVPELAGKVTGAQQQAQELKELRERLEKDKKEQMQRLAAERERFEKEERERMAQEVKAYEQQLEAERAKENARAERAMAELAKKKQALIQQREASQKQELEKLGEVGDAEKKQILDKHQTELAQLEETLDQERARQKKQLQERLAKKREQKRLQKLAQAEEELAAKMREREEEENKKVEEIAEKQATALTNEVAREDTRMAETVQRSGPRLSIAPRSGVATAARTSLAGLAAGLAAPASMAAAALAKPAAQQTPAAAGATTFATPGNPAEWNALLVQSPLYSKLEEIERVLRSGALQVGASDFGMGAQAKQVRSSKGKAAAAAEDSGSGGAAVAGGGSGGGDSAGGSVPASVYLDPLDAAWTCGGELKELQVNDLSAMHFVVYKFGMYITDLLTVHCQLEPVSLLIADNLPANELQHNAFRNSFWFEVPTRTLFLRKERLDNIGAFTVVLVHCLAHISVRNMDNDSRPDFLHAFYRALRVCYEELFFARSKPTDALPSTAGADGVNPIEAVFRRMKTVEEKDSLINELIDVRSIADADDDGEGTVFNKEAMLARMERYTTFQMSTKLKEFLSSLEVSHEDPGDGDVPADAAHLVAERRLAELTSKAEDGDDSAGTAGPRLQKQASGASNVDVFETFLERQIDELNDRLDDLNTEYVKSMKEFLQVGQNIKALQEKLKKENNTLGAMEEGSDEHRTQIEKVQKLTVAIRRAKGNLSRINMSKENAAKRLTRFKEELKQKQAQLDEHRARSADEKKNVGETKLDAMISSQTRPRRDKSQGGSGDVDEPAPVPGDAGDDDGDAK